MATSGKESNRQPEKNAENIDKKHENSTNVGENSGGNQNTYNMCGYNNLDDRVQYKNIREYAQVLNCWMLQYRMMSAFSSMQYHMLHSVQQNFNHMNTAHAQPSSNMGTGTDASRNGSSPRNTNTEGTQYRVPMLWRRVVAEFLDFVLLFYTKILVTVAVLKQLGYMEDNFIDLEAQIPIFSDFGELDYDKMFSLTTELIALEVVNRLCITLVEAMCLRRGYAGSIGGATPGKKIMQLRVISFTEIRNARNGNILVVGARNPGFFNALIRSIIKNFSLAFFFPACFTAFFFRFNRAAYDVLAQTVVVEVENRHQEH
ncbi:RDD [Mactra antiquata]